jgi:type IV pilus assembly protein PilZ
MGENDPKQEKKKAGCPYCTQAIPENALHCPWCGVSFGAHTMAILRTFQKEKSPDGADERRREDRIPRKYRIAYTTPQALVNSYLYNISVGGVFVRTSNPLEPGTTLTLKITLPDAGKELDVECEVTWVRKEEQKAPEGLLPPGMGVKFLNLLPEGRARIEKILGQPHP